MRHGERVMIAVYYLGATSAAACVQRDAYMPAVVSHAPRERPDHDEPSQAAVVAFVAGTESAKATVARSAASGGESTVYMW